MFSICSAVYILSARLSMFAIRSQAVVYFVYARLSTYFRGILHLFRIGFTIFQLLSYTDSIKAYLTLFKHILGGQRECA
ncbi:uncharacterized protein HD556DRAFT_1383410 [Suillus plorans]|uniref:Uncharacterized protein n=1 Tax=Suillus plorans TaxID=116603 RepID=A0A9P7DGJ5_9AGAM|nr:uncharacterized protein HD556DRAFT_1409502 [Suillus plorans]XP_041158613.1 uncharacterized protein HD556DRAFT_1383407 [Suillus plorans]XP_041158614.1 uncharacterized protein HD556DRAFT_1383410 [Suillus plorans]KAG1787448.1 hypothetical protein HD556DRAFT_1409502 [Suillus plorans]KAG1791875.1 hypothetical protein HD556DRAFT_1383407 [Suillus plorans]KAG1791876.1 hypothetical protein HD556DRAFT_1383410 [Suillus plorans]